MIIARGTLWRHPEWWTLALAAGAWLVLLMRSRAADHVGHAVESPFLNAAVVEWTTMVAAMMLPTLIAPVREVAGRSFWYRRHRAVALFLAGYISTWIVFGAAATAAAGWLPTSERRAWLPALLLMAAAWQLSPLKWRAVIACHRRITLAPAGWPASRDCLRQGWTIGWPCVVACGPMMAACALVHDVRLMAAVAALGWFDRAAFRPHPYRTIAALICIAAVAALGGG